MEIGRQDIVKCPECRSLVIRRRRGKCPVCGRSVSVADECDEETFERVSQLPLIAPDADGSEAEEIAKAICERARRSPFLQPVHVAGEPVLVLATYRIWSLGMRVSRVAWIDWIGPKPSALRGQRNEISREMLLRCNHNTRFADRIETSAPLIQLNGSIARERIRTRYGVEDARCPMLLPCGQLKGIDTHAIGGYETEGAEPLGASGMPVADGRHPVVIAPLPSPEDGRGAALEALRKAMRDATEDVHGDYWKALEHEEIAAWEDVQEEISWWKRNVSLRMAFSNAFAYPAEHEGKSAWNQKRFRVSTPYEDVLAPMWVVPVSKDALGSGEEFIAVNAQSRAVACGDAVRERPWAAPLLAVILCVAALIGVHLAYRHGTMGATMMRLIGDDYTGLMVVTAILAAIVSFFLMISMSARARRKAGAVSRVAGKGGSSETAMSLSDMGTSLEVSYASVDMAVNDPYSLPVIEDYFDYLGEDGEEGETYVGPLIDIAPPADE